MRRMCHTRRAFESLTIGPQGIAIRLHCRNPTHSVTAQCGTDATESRKSAPGCQQQLSSNVLTWLRQLSSKCDWFIGKQSAKLFGQLKSNIVVNQETSRT